MIQPHLPIRLPCYDFTPVIRPAFDSSLLSLGSLASGISDSHGVTGGVYKTRERIHRSILRLFIHLRIPVHYYRWVPPFGNLRISGYLLLPAAYRSLSRPSSAPSAKASALCSFSLDLLLVFSVCCCVATRSLFSHIPQYAPSSFTHAPCISSENPAQTFSCLLPSSFISVASVNNLLS